MATWQELCEKSRAIGGELIGDGMLRFDVVDENESELPTVYAFNEVIKPSFEMLLLKSVLMPIAVIDVPTLLREHGQMLAGSFSYQSMFDPSGREIDGMLAFSTNIPLASLDLSEPSNLFLYIYLFAGATKHVQQQLRPPATPLKCRNPGCEAVNLPTPLEVCDLCRVPTRP
ncbi:MAG: hypothetical protein JWQ18_3477 [Conexibacter sp.]|nr:hypothetical protein [Conexibacter sp.]